MITHTFSIFPGIGPRIERYLWRIGVFSWREFLCRAEIPGISPSRKALLDSYVSQAEEAWEAGNALYFQRLLGHAGAWRLWGSLSDDALCLDIETDGGRAGEGIPTVVGFYSHGEYRSYLAGAGLTAEAVQRELDDAKLLVTFSGATFDIPYLKSHFPGLDLYIPHLDLCPAGHKLGLKGGLKKVEKTLGISRADEVDGLGGYEAVLLWQAHIAGREGALDRLIQYNREDTVNLHALAEIICGQLSEASGLPSLIAERENISPALQTS